MRGWSRPHQEVLPARCLLLSVLPLLSVGLLLLLLLLLHLSLCPSLPQGLLVSRTQVQDGESSLSEEDRKCVPDELLNVSLFFSVFLGFQRHLSTLREEEHQATPPGESSQATPPGESSDSAHTDSSQKGHATFLVHV